jgi:hypothetical protein
LSVHKGDMNICSPEKVIFPEGNLRGKYDYFEGEQISYLPYAREIYVLFHQANVLVNSAKWNLLAIFVYKIIISEHENKQWSTQHYTEH